MAGYQKPYKESDIVHYLIENIAQCVKVNEKGLLSLDYAKVTNLHINEDEYNKPYES
ncbi:hypothetical protein [Haemophilus parainfluenzae]|uniref:hypothetical protein n=1 Tax=Haemophilus parainfluenzae TaxID=729 RepID=UPI001FB5102E|nr:hypothetical protein [Haemophilus parainfluenzae]